MASRHGGTSESVNRNSQTPRRLDNTLPGEIDASQPRYDPCIGRWIVQRPGVPGFELHEPKAEVSER
jgi:hypothetical protein